jgi:metal-responsive CopG/Arc/MetJ family transcriptional regulator
MPRLLAAIRTHYARFMAKSTIRIRLPDQILEALDQRAAALGLKRNELIVRAVERALQEHAAWSPRLLKAIGTPRPVLDEAAGEMMNAIRTRRSRNEAPELRRSA